MLLCYYFISNKYISVVIFCKKKNQFIVYQDSFLKNFVNWHFFCKFFEEFLYEAGLKKKLILLKK